MIYRHSYSHHSQQCSITVWNFADDIQRRPVACLCTLITFHVHDIIFIRIGQILKIQFLFQIFLRKKLIFSIIAVKMSRLKRHKKYLIVSISTLIPLQIFLKCFCMFFPTQSIGFLKKKSTEQCIICHNSRNVHRLIQYDKNLLINILTGQIRNLFNMFQRHIVTDSIIYGRNQQKSRSNNQTDHNIGFQYNTVFHCLLPSKRCLTVLTLRWKTKVCLRRKLDTPVILLRDVLYLLCGFFMITGCFRHIITLPCGPGTSDVTPAMMIHL